MKFCIMSCFFSYDHQFWHLPREGSDPRWQHSSNMLHPLWIQNADILCYFVSYHMLLWHMAIIVNGVQVHQFQTLNNTKFNRKPTCRMMCWRCNAFLAYCRYQAFSLWHWLIQVARGGTIISSVPGSSSTTNGQGL